MVASRLRGLRNRGFSGGTMERPALKMLIADIEAGEAFWPTSARIVLVNVVEVCARKIHLAHLVCYSGDYRLLERGISEPASKQFQCLGNFRCRRWQDGDAISTACLQRQGSGSPLFERPYFRTSPVADSARMPCARRADGGRRLPSISTDYLNDERPLCFSTPAGCWHRQ